MPIAPHPCSPDETSAEVISSQLSRAWRCRVLLLPRGTAAHAYATRDGARTNAIMVYGVDADWLSGPRTAYDATAFMDCRMLAHALDIPLIAVTLSGGLVYHRTLTDPYRDALRDGDRHLVRKDGYRTIAPRKTVRRQGGGAALMPIA